MWIGHSRNGLHHKIHIPDSWSGRCVLLVFPGTGTGSAEPFTRCVSAVRDQCPKLEDGRIKFRGWLVIVEPNLLAWRLSGLHFVGLWQVLGILLYYRNEAYLGLGSKIYC